MTNLTRDLEKIETKLLTSEELNAELERRNGNLEVEKKSLEVKLSKVRL